MTATETIRIALIKKNMSVSELAAELGFTSQNLSSKFKRNNFSENDLRAIAEILNCDLRIYLLTRIQKRLFRV